MAIGKVGKDWDYLETSAMTLTQSTISYVTHVYSESDTNGHKLHARYSADSRPNARQVIRSCYATLTTHLCDTERMLGP